MSPSVARNLPSGEKIAPPMVPDGCAKDRSNSPVDTFQTASLDPSIETAHSAVGANAMGLASLSRVA